MTRALLLTLYAMTPASWLAVSHAHANGFVRDMGLFTEATTEVASLVGWSLLALVAAIAIGMFVASRGR